jgi:hypothetical protein
MKNYDDIINLPHHISNHHTQMSISDRAAQFAPFAALTGYAEAINEAGRLVDKKKELTEEEKINISNTINYLINNINDDIEVSIIYFVKDQNKDGGEYKSIKGIVKRYEQIDNTIILKSKFKISLEDILLININR